MSMQPHQQSAPPGWYPQPGGIQRYWNGQVWTGDVAALPVHPQPVYVQAARPRAISGMSNGQRLIHFLLTICTLGLWAPVWWLMERAQRKRIIY